MIPRTLLRMATTNMQREMRDPIQSRDGPVRVVSDPHRLATSNTLCTEWREEMFRCSGGATTLSRHIILPFTSS